MIKIQNLTHVGYNGKLEIINFEFVFDNTSHLPTKVYSMGQNNYIIADGSTATNVITGAKYTYNNYNWTKQQGSGEPINPKSSEITNNGTYSVINNDTKGFNSVNVNIEGGGNLIEKTITENGEYLPAQDEATAYSKVVVDVDTSINSIRCSSFGRYDVATSSWTLFGRTVLKKPNDGVIELINNGGVAGNVQIFFSTEAINQIIIPSSFSGFVNLTFTPSSDFTGFSSAEGLTINMYGDEITPGDGKCYYAYCTRTENPYQGDYFTVMVKKGSLDFSFVIE